MCVCVCVAVCIDTCAHVIVRCAARLPGPKRDDHHVKDSVSRRHECEKSVARAEPEADHNTQRSLHPHRCFLTHAQDGCHTFGHEALQALDRQRRGAD